MREDGLLSLWGLVATTNNPEQEQVQLEALQQ